MMTLASPLRRRPTTFALWRTFRGALIGAVLAFTALGMGGTIPAVAQETPEPQVLQPSFDDGLHQRALGAMQRLNLRVGSDGRLDECAALLSEPHRQVLRIQTEMMLTALACSTTYRQASLIPTYENFLFRQAEVLLDAQDRVLRELRRQGGDDFAVEDFQAVLANEEAQILSARGTNTYCRMRASRWDFTMTATPDQFEFYTMDLARRFGVTCNR